MSLHNKTYSQSTYLLYPFQYYLRPNSSELRFSFFFFAVCPVGISKSCGMWDAVAERDREIGSGSIESSEAEMPFRGVPCELLEWRP